MASRGYILPVRAARPDKVHAGVREVKDRLSELLRRVRAGATVTITDRGQVVAELRPPAPQPVSTRAKMVRDGQLLPARRAYDPTLAMDVRARLPRGTAQRLLDADRDERR